jgi:hypothetical protein
MKSKNIVIENNILSKSYIDNLVKATFYKASLEGSNTLNIPFSLLTYAFEKALSAKRDLVNSSELFFTSNPYGIYFNDIKASISNCITSGLVEELEKDKKYLIANGEGLSTYTANLNEEQIRIIHQLSKEAYFLINQAKNNSNLFKKKAIGEK